MAFPAPIPVSLALSPVEAFLAWPRQVPVLALWSGSGLIAQPAAGDVNADPEARWTVLGIPSSWRMLQHGASAIDVRAFLRGLSPFAEPLADPAPAAGDSTPSAAGVAASTLAASTLAASTLVPGWFLRVSYEVGEALEPATTRQGPAAAPISAPASARWPLAEAARVDQALIFDHAQNQWYAVGHARRLVALVTDALATAERFELGALASQWGEAGYQGAVREAIELIHAGDCYQVNLAHAMTAPFAGSARALFAAMCQRAAPWHGAYMERDEADGTRRALLSISPELFLAYDATSRTLATRPMKGTRRAGGGARDGVGDGVGDAAGDARRDLEHSVKDHAELAMIVDMMRNDLGRSAELGSVRVDAPRRIEHHGTGAGAVLQATGLVRATLREGVELADAIADAFPPASVTGAPKIRAMQIIRELEPSRRDAYCGCIGMRSDHGDLALNVAIRTAMIQGRIDGTPAAGEARDSEPRDAAARDAFSSATLTYHVGAGIVADSDPSAEWRETLDKAGHIAAIADSNHPNIDTAARAPNSGDQVSGDQVSGSQGGHS